MIGIYFDPLDKNCKSKTGAAVLGETITFAIFACGEDCKLAFTDDYGEEYVYVGERQDDKFVFSVNLPKTGIYFYRFILNGENIGLGKNLYAERGNDKFELLVCEKYDFPNRAGETIYQIFPDRFARFGKVKSVPGKKMRKWGEEPEYLPNENGKILNDDFFGGNFAGIKRKIPYLKSLGVTTVYLNPIVKSDSNHRYDTGDYLSFDSLLGDDDDFKSLVDCAKENGVSIIFDGVFNHVGDDSIYFNKYSNYETIGAYNSKKSPYYKWFTFQKYPDEYTSWWGIETLPTIRRGAKGYEKLVTGKGGVIDRYLSFGVSGVRLDVVDELSDAFIKKINKKVKSYGKDKIVIGEVWEDATNKIAYGERKKYFTAGELDGVMNYPLRTAIISYVLTGDADAVYAVTREQIDHYPAKALNLLMNVIGTHDTPRIITCLGKNGKLAETREEMSRESLTQDEYALAVKRLKCAALLQFTLYGNPSVYYGDEIGMQGNKDPFNRRCFDIKNADAEILSFYRSLGRLRKQYDCFKGETVNIKKCFGAFSFSRVGETSAVTVVVNAGERTIDTDLSEKAQEFFRGEKVTALKLGKYDFAVFIKKNG